MPAGMQHLRKTPCQLSCNHSRQRVCNVTVGKCNRGHAVERVRSISHVHSRRRLCRTCCSGIDRPRSKTSNHKAGSRILRTCLLIQLLEFSIVTGSIVVLVGRKRCCRTKSDCCTVRQDIVLMRFHRVIGYIRSEVTQTNNTVKDE
jgi:hypothetical protein